MELERLGKLHALVTQNIDGLHQRAGSSPDKVIEVHGTIRFSRTDWFTRCAQVAALCPKAASSTGAFRVLTQSKKLAMWVNVSSRPVDCHRSPPGRTTYDVVVEDLRGVPAG